MSKQLVNLLVYLSDKTRLNQSPEREIYTLVSLITRVHNMKLIAGGDVCKAFVQVVGLSAAQRVVESIGRAGKSKCRVSAVISKNADISYPRSVGELLGRHDRTRTTNSALSDAECAFGGKLSQEQSASGLQINFFKSKPSTGENQCEENVTTSVCTICVTHTDVEAMKGGRVLRIFRRFGRIVSLTFDYERVFWAVTYRSDKEVNKIANAIANDTLYGYQLSEQEEFPQPKYLRIAYAHSSPTLEEISVMVARVHMPSAVYACKEQNTSTPYFVVDFKCSRDAADALVVLVNAQGDRASFSLLVIA